MGIPAPVHEAYDTWRSAILAVEKVVGGTLDEWTKKHGFPFVGRVKHVESISEKIESGRYQRWLELDDLYAATIIVPSHSDVQIVVTFLEKAFVGHVLKTRTTTVKPPDVFRFDDTRWYGTLRKESTSQLPKGTDRLLFEVQVRTAFEHAWAVATHDFSYKSNAVDWARLRLAASLRSSVEQLDLMVELLPTIADSVEISPHPSTEARSRVDGIFQELVREGCIPTELEPASWSRFSENLMSLVRSAKSSNVSERSIQFAQSVADELRGADTNDLPISGSLFQLIVGIAVENDLLGADPLRRHTIVESQDLADIYGIKTVPIPFVFEQLL